MAFRCKCSQGASTPAWSRVNPQTTTCEPKRSAGAMCKDVTSKERRPRTHPKVVGPAARNRKGSRERHTSRAMRCVTRTCQPSLRRDMQPVSFPDPPPRRATEPKSGHGRPHRLLRTNGRTRRFGRSIRTSAWKRNAKHGAHSVRHATAHSPRRHCGCHTRPSAIQHRIPLLAEARGKPRCDRPPRKAFDLLLPGRCSFRYWGSPTTRLYSPRESVPSRRGLDSAWADALLGFRLLRDFSPVIVRDAFTPSTLSGFPALPVLRPSIQLPLRA